MGARRIPELLAKDPHARGGRLGIHRRRRVVVQVDRVPVRPRLPSSFRPLLLLHDDRPRFYTTRSMEGTSYGKGRGSGRVRAVFFDAGGTILNVRGSRRGDLRRRRRPEGVPGGSGRRGAGLPSRLAAEPDPPSRVRLPLERRGPPGGVAPGGRGQPRRPGSGLRGRRGLRGALRSLLGAPSPGRSPPGRWRRSRPCAPMGSPSGSCRTGTGGFSSAWSAWGSSPFSTTWSSRMRWASRSLTPDLPDGRRARRTASLCPPHRGGLLRAGHRAGHRPRMARPLADPGKSRIVEGAGGRRRGKFRRGPAPDPRGLNRIKTNTPGKVHFPGVSSDFLQLSARRLKKKGPAKVVWVERVGLELGEILAGP